jgi:hypothetical protein
MKNSLLAILTLVAFSCQKEKDPQQHSLASSSQQPVIQRPLFIYVKSGDSTILRFSTVPESTTTLVMAVDIMNARTHDIIETFVNRWVSNTASGGQTVRYQLANRLFAGTHTIETEGQLEEYWYRSSVNSPTVRKSFTIIPKSISNVEKPVKEIKKDCSFKGVHNCVANKIDEMGWIEYGACLFDAPTCYTVMWAQCAWDNCT